MSLNNQNMIRSLNKPHRANMKDQHHSLSPNVRGIQSPNKPIHNNLYQKNNIVNHQNYNIKINKINKQKKEQVIEGDLNFNAPSKPPIPKQINRNNFVHNNKNKRGMPTKSPVPITKNYKPKDLLAFQKIFNSNARYNRPDSKKPKTNNIMIKPQNRLIKTNVIGGNMANNTSKSFGHVTKKVGDRSHSPMIRTTQNKAVNIMALPPKANKTRYVSKSPILGKSSVFNRYGNFNISLLNSGKNPPKKKIIKKAVNNNNNHKKVSNINPNNKKGNTVISGEIQDNSNNYNKNNVNNNPINANNVNQQPQIVNNNNVIKPNIIKNEQNENKIEYNNEQNNLRNANTKQRPPSENNNNKELNVKPIQDIEKQQQIQDNNEQIKKVEKMEIPISKINNNKQEEQTKKNIRSQSQGPIDPLKKIEKESNEGKQEIEKEKPNETPKKIIKKIKDILPYTHVGFDGEEPKENNQDNYFIFKNLADNADYIYFSVCDGHGVEGHFVSEFIKEVLPYYMSENLKGKNILQDTEKIHRLITETFLIVNNMLVDNENINSLFSGTTCVSVIYTPERLIVPNIGDSRAVLGRYDKATNTYKAIDLSRDHKPTDEDEAKRIYENDGRIQPFTEDGEFVGPQRVWIKDEEVPGLAMTRSFGDRVAATVGVMSEPEIKEFNFDPNDKFMIIASDGVWEFISSQECIEMIGKFYEKNDLKNCCEYIYQESSKRWLKEEEVIDDTTMILVYFE